MLHTKKIGVALVVLVALAGITGLIAHQVSAAAMTYASQTTVSVVGQTISYTSDPSGQCFGEDITLTGGTILIQSHGVMDQNGAHGTFDVARQGVQGVGAQSGALYHMTGTDTATQSIDGGFQTTMNDHINIVGQGPDNNAVISSVLHLTVDANGQITAAVNDFSITCH